MKKTLALVVLGIVAASQSAHAAPDAAFTTGVSDLQAAAVAFCGGIVAAIFGFGVVKIGIPASKWVVSTFAGLFSR